MELLVKNNKITEISETGITFSEKLSFAEWEAIGQDLQRVGRSWQWWIGDWLNFGESRYGEKYAQAIEETGIGLSTLQNCAWVAGQVESSTRVEVLSWSHHRTVAKFEPQEQRKILVKALKNSLTVSELKKELKDPDSWENAPPGDTAEWLVNRSDVDGLRRKVNELTKAIKDAPELPGFEMVNDLSNRIRIDLLNIKSAIVGCVPFNTCPYCHGNDSQCDGCKGRGWVNKHDFNSAPKELQDEITAVSGRGSK